MVRPIARMMLAAALLPAFMCLSATPAFAADEKVATPTLEKRVSAGGTFSDHAEAAVGDTVRYRIDLTLPESIAEIESLEYTVVDEPDAAVVPDLDAARAVVLASDGTARNELKLSTRTEDGRSILVLGDIRSKVADLSFGDVIRIEYPAHLLESASGTLRNVAYLRYRMDGEPGQTVESAASIVLATSGAKAGGKGSPFDATGNLLAGALAPLLAAAAVLASLSWAVRPEPEDPRPRREVRPMR